MRKFFLFLMALGVSLAMVAGDKLSAPTKVFLQQHANAVANGKSILASPKAVNGVECVECFISLEGSSFSELEKMGVNVTGNFKDFVTAQVPVNKLEAVARIKSVKQVGIARNARLLTDVAKGIVNADKAWDGTNYGLPQGFTGQGVVLGIIDDGIQFNHRAFLDDNGNTRVKAVYMPNATSANGGTRATVDGVQLMGYQYTTASQIGNLTCDDSSESHGTHTSGCAAGSHVGNYAGMAPEADLILAGCGSSLTETAIVSSAKYIGNYAKNVLGKPCVISISLGSDTGPHDGTSSICRAYADVAEQYGAVILLAAGNEADITGAAEKTLASDDDYMAITHSVSYTYYGGACDIWNSTGDELQVKVIVNGSESSWMTSGTYNNVTVQGAVDESNGRYNLYIESQTSSATYVIKGKGGNTIHAYTDCYYSSLSSSTSAVNGYTRTPGTYEGSMCDDMTCTKAISVGAMCSRNTSNTPYSQGDIAYFSSYGVDCNGVNQPFITAPGHYVISSINGYDSGQSSSWSTTYNGTTYKWGQMSGTSMATPTAAGVVVLYLQADPTLDVDRVKDVIANTATAYSNPSSPALQRGHGIINALTGIEYILNNQGPTIVAKPSELSFEGYQGETYTQTINVKGYNLTGPISIAKSGSNVYSVSPTTISADDAYTGVDVTVTYAPTAAGETTATLTLTSADAETVTVPITGVAQPRVPTIITDVEDLSFSAKLSTPMTKAVNVTGLFLTNDITVTLNDQNGVFSVSPTTISKNSTGADTPVAVNVTFTSDVEGEFTGSLTLTSNGAETKTVELTAKATDKGTASDPYLDIAKYETIDEAGANISGMETIYKYTEYGDAAWLTVSCYGALKADATQNWLNFEGTEKTGTETWSATDIFLGNTSYFGGNSAYYVNWNEAYSNYYVTNCTQAKLYAKNLSSSNYFLYMRIYECTVNADGTVTAGSTAIDTQTNTTANPEVLTSIALDPSKVYKVQVYNDYAHLYEIGFQTELNNPMIKATPSDLTISSAPGETKTATIDVRGKMLPGDVTVTLTDPSNVFAISATSISKTAAEAGTQLTVTFASDEEAVYEGTITLTSGELTATVNLTGICSDGGTASDKYLNIAKYATIDDAGASVSGMTTIYKYTETNDCGWLTVSNYGAQKTDAAQEWIVNSLTTTAAQTWNATDVFTGDDYYFGTSQSYASDWNGFYQRFYVTNCTQVKQFAYNRSSSYPLYMRIYECTENADGSITAGATAIDTQKSSVYSQTEILTSATLDASKIYMVELYNDYSYLYEIAFQTPLPVVEETTLAYILENGVNGQEYTVSNDLVRVEVADVENYAFLTDKFGNWIRVAAADNDVFNVFVENPLIIGGTLKGTLSDVELNPLLTITVQPEGMWPLSPDFINYVEAVNLADPFTFVSNQVVDVTGYWNASEGTLRAYDPSSGAQGQSLTLDYTWGANVNTLENGKRYTVRCAITLKEPWRGLLDYDYDFQNYTGHALRMPETPTGIGVLEMNGYNDIVNVFNVQGQLIKRNVKFGEATKGLPSGVYIVGGKKMIVK